MSKSFDFNSIVQETLETKLGDKVLHVTTPPERLIEQLAASQAEITKLLSDSVSVSEKSRTSYDLIAKLLSCNLENEKVTADDLRDKYNIHPVALVAFVPTYMDFINSFHTAKN